ncbi:thioredoxin family protein [Glaciecola sp. 1036]|uniref:thioredoxin family protein n=1 Tax=Alteromonadaceae TaxID=72275 RepID=UPI003D00CD57
MSSGIQGISQTGHLFPEPIAMLWFSAQWCGPCKQITPVINMLEQAYAGTVRIVKIDVDEEVELAQQMGVRAVPTMILLDRNKRLDTHIGAGSFAELSQWLQSNITLIA